jgi:hypothetical protein
MTFKLSSIHLVVVFIRSMGHKFLKNRPPLIAFFPVITHPAVDAQKSLRNSAEFCYHLTHNSLLTHLLTILDNKQFALKLILLI